MTDVHPVAATIDGLIALWTGHAALAYDVNGVSVPMLVVDGPPLSEFDDLRVLAVGVGSQSLTGINSPFAGVQASQGNTGFGPGGRQTSRYEVACQLGVWSGDTNLVGVRTDAYATLRTLARLLTASRTLGGVVDWARIVRDAYQPAQGRDGSGVAIDFTVQVEATRFEG